MSNPFTALDGLLSGVVNAVFGEMFEFRAYKADTNVNAPKIPDDSRATFQALCIWNAQTNSKTPTARGSVQDDNAHNWTASIPEVIVDDLLCPWPVQPGDRVLRLKTGAEYQISVPPRPDGMGRTCIQLTARKRTA